MPPEKNHYSESLAMTDDSQIIAYASEAPYLLIYAKFGKKFAIQQNIVEKSAKQILTVDLSGDGSKLTAYDSQGVVFVYKNIDNKY